PDFLRGGVNGDLDPPHAPRLVASGGACARTGGDVVTINDAHCHFFSPQFFGALARQQLVTPAAPSAVAAASASESYRELQWADRIAADAVADRWIAALDAHGVSRAVLIASVAGDEGSVAEAVARHPSRFVGFFMLDASAPDAVERARRAIDELQ